MNPEIVFNHWISKEPHPMWMCHRNLLPHFEEAIINVLKAGYREDYMCQAIDNYYLARTTPGTFWHDVCSIKWDIGTFFKGGKNKEIANWLRFSPDIFELKYTEEYLRKQKRKTRPASPPQPVAPKMEGSIFDYIDPNSRLGRALEERRKN